MEEHHFDNKIPKSESEFHEKPSEGLKACTRDDSYAEAGNVSNNGYEISPEAKQMSLDDKKKEGMSVDECRAFAHDDAVSRESKPDKELEESPLSNMAAFPKSRSPLEKFENEKKNNTKENKARPLSPTSEGHKLNASLAEAEEQYVYFWQKDSPFSQWHSSTLIVRDEIFCCAEQYMMYTKAVLLHDDRLAKKIMNCKEPSRMKSLGRQTEQFSEDLWVHNCLHVVKEGNVAKFNQNSDLKRKLFHTFPRILVEASPYDKVWGIGLKKTDQCAWNETTWEGKNLLGYILTEVRDELMFEDKIIQAHDRKIYLEKLTKELIESSTGKTGAYDRCPGYRYGGYYHNVQTDVKRPDHNIVSRRDESSAYKETKEFRNHQRDYRLPKEDEMSDLEKNALDRSRRSQSEDSSTHCENANKGKTDQCDDIHEDAKKENGAVKNAYKHESKHETNVSSETHHLQGSSRKDGNSQKINKNETPRFGKKEDTEPVFRAVCTEPLRSDTAV